MYNNFEYKPTHVTTSSTTQVFTGKGVLHSIIVNATAASTFAIFDSAIGITSGTVAILKASVAENTYTYDATIANGLYIVNGTTGDYTVMWVK
jgi:hypothetical protein